MQSVFGTRIDVRDAMSEDRAELSALLARLAPEDWARVTAAAPWTVRDVAAHVLGDDLSRLSRGRDGWSGDGPAPGETLPSFIHRLNDEWVRSTARISPRALCDVLEATTERVMEFWRAADLDALGEPVTWAGPDPAPVWLDCARDFTEYWAHQQQIRSAVGLPDRAGGTGPALDTMLRAVPHTLADTPRPDGASLAVDVAGHGRWTWRHVAGRWRPVDPDGTSGTVVRFADAGTLWRLCVRMLEPSQARVRVDGDAELAQRMLRIVSIIR